MHFSRGCVGRRPDRDMGVILGKWHFYAVSRDGAHRVTPLPLLLQSASADLPLCWRRPDHVTVRGGLRLRRPLRPRAILAFLQPPQPSSSTSCHHHQSASSKAAEASVRAACARLGVDVTPQQGGTTDKMLQTAQPALLSTAEAALEAFKDRPAHIVFVAGKQHQAEELARCVDKRTYGRHIFLP